MSSPGLMPTPSVPYLSFIPHARGAKLKLDASYVCRPPRFASHRPHRLRFFEVLFLTHGRGRGVVDGEAFELAPGRAVFAAPGQVMSLELSGDSRRHVLCFEDDFLASDPAAERFRRLPLLRRRGGGPSLELECRERRWMEDRLEAMSEEVRLLDSNSRGILRALLQEMVLRVERLVARQRPALTRDESSRWAERFLGTLEETFRESHRVEDLARRLNTSPSHLNALTHRHFQTSPKRLIARRLRDEAKRLLEETELPASRIALDLGFSDAAYFSRFFKRQVGMPPGDFRRGTTP